MKLIEFNGKQYPAFQANGNASQFAIPYAKHFCYGLGLDIGCNRIDWSYPNSIPIDIEFNNGFDAYHLPDGEFDYIYSSHCLEHLHDWVMALDYWISKIKIGGYIFLYLPDISQEYWRPWNNKKHKHVFTPEIIKTYFDAHLTNVYVSGIDINNSFMIVGEKYDKTISK